MSEENKIWEKQDYETAISFSHFQKYYLLQPSPRTITKAYRQFQVERGRKTPKQIKKLNASGAWNDWANGRDNDSNKIDGSKTWAERADAYDKSLFYLKQKDYEEARSNLLKNEVKDVEAQLKLWEEISMSFALHVKGQKEEAELNDNTFNPAQFINKGKEIWKWREDIAVFQRRSFKMPSVIKQQPEDDKEDEVAKIEWEEPKWNKNDVGVGKEELEKNINNEKGNEKN